MNSFKFLLFLFFFFFTGASFAQNQIKVIYDSESNLEIADYFLNDLQILFGKKKEISVELQRKYGFTKPFSKIKAYSEMILLFNQNQNIKLRYYHPKTKKSKEMTIKRNQVFKRYVSLDFLKLVFEKDFETFKKRVLILPLANKTNQPQNDYLSGLISNAIGNEMHLSEKALVVFSTAEPDLWKISKLSQKAVGEKEARKLMDLIHADAAVYGSYQFIKGKVRLKLNLIRKENKKIIFSSEENVVLDQGLFDRAGLISKQFSEQALKRIPAEKKEEIKVKVKPKKEEPNLALLKKLKEEIKSQETDKQPLQPDEIRKIEVFKKRELEEYVPAFVLPFEHKKKRPIILPPKEKNYTDSGIAELGGMIWADLNGITGKAPREEFLFDIYAAAFIIKYFRVGLEDEISYNFKTKKTNFSFSLLAGIALPLTDNVFYHFSLKGGYKKADSVLELQNVYGAETGFKFKIAKHLLINLSAIYTFDYIQKVYHDKIKASISFSGYF